MKVFLFTSNEEEDTAVYLSMKRALEDNPVYSYDWKINSDRTEAWTVGPERIIQLKVTE